MEEKKEGRGRIRFFFVRRGEYKGCVRTASLSGYCFITYFFPGESIIFEYVSSMPLFWGVANNVMGRGRRRAGGGGVIIKLNEKKYTHEVSMCQTKQRDGTILTVKINTINADW